MTLCYNNGHKMVPTILRQERVNPKLNISCPIGASMQDMRSLLFYVEEEYLGHTCSQCGLTVNNKNNV
jgi:hypothetical protein